MDFLFRLAQQNLGVAPAVEPLIPSRFEPGMHAAAPDFAVSEEESVTSAPPRHSRMAASPAPAPALFRRPTPPRHGPFPEHRPCGAVDESTVTVTAPGPANPPRWTCAQSRTQR
ncbi:MAG: hypothetical protein R2851_19640 [Caldilineaceae bacterium]